MIAMIVVIFSEAICFLYSRLIYISIQEQQVLSLLLMMHSIVAIHRLMYSIDWCDHWSVTSLQGFIVQFFLTAKLAQVIKFGSESLTRLTTSYIYLQARRTQ